MKTILHSFLDAVYATYFCVDVCVKCISVKMSMSLSCVSVLTSSSAMAERLCNACFMILRGWVTLRLNFRLKVTFCANIYGLLVGEWLYYNFAAGSFHKKKLCGRLYSTENEFYSRKQKKSLFGPPFGRLRGNV